MPNALAFGARRVCFIPKFFFRARVGVFQSNFNDRLQVGSAAIGFPALYAQPFKHGLKNIRKPAEVSEVSEIKPLAAKIKTAERIALRAVKRPAEPAVLRTLFFVAKHLVRLVYLLELAFIAAGFVRMIFVCQFSVRFF